MSGTLSHLLTFDWPGQKPTPGQYVAKDDGRVFYRIAAVQEVGALVALTVTRHMRIPPESVVHPWPEQSTGSIMRALPVPADLVPAPSPQAAATPATATTVAPPSPHQPPPPTPSRPTPRADAESLRAASEAGRRRLCAALEPPPFADPATWQDVQDALTTRTPPMVRGYSRAGVLERMHRRGSADVSLEMIVAAGMFAADFDAETIGLSGRDRHEPAMGRTAPGPVTGPPKAAVDSVQRGRVALEVLRAIGPSPSPELLHHVAVANKDVSAFCKANPGPNGRIPDAKVMAGRLYAILGIVGIAYGVIARPDRALDRPEAG